MKCEVCKSLDLYKVKLRDSDLEVVVCEECETVYELDKEGKIITNEPFENTNYFECLNNLFKGWDNVKEKTPYCE